VNTSTAKSLPLDISPCKWYRNYGMTPKVLTLRKKQADGWDASLLVPLREQPTNPAVQRVEKVLSLLVAADTCAGEQREFIGYLRAPDHHQAERAAEFDESLREARRVCRLIDAALSHYKMEWLVGVAIGGFWIAPRIAVKGNDRWAHWEARAVGALLRFANKPGELSRFRRCAECRQWFYAADSKQRFCGPPCYRRHESQKPAFKEQRARYMSETYRPREKKEEAESKRQVGFSEPAKGKRGKA
jgi:hypothetical protein